MIIRFLTILFQQTTTRTSRKMNFVPSENTSKREFRIITGCPQVNNRPQSYEKFQNLCNTIKYLHE